MLEGRGGWLKSCSFFSRLVPKIKGLSRLLGEKQIYFPERLRFPSAPVSAQYSTSQLVLWTAQTQGLAFALTDSRQVSVPWRERV